MAITFKHSNSIRTDIVRAWEKFGQKRYVRLVAEAGLGDHEWEVVLFGSTAAPARPGRPVVVKRFDKAKHAIEVEVDPRQGGYKLAARMHYSGVVGWDDVCQRLETAANRLATEGRVADRGEGRAGVKTVETVVNIPQLVKVRDGLTAIIEFGDRMREAAGRLAELEAARPGREQTVAEARDILEYAQDELAAAWENIEAAASTADELLTRLRREVRDAEAMLVDAKEDLSSTEREIAQAKARADEGQAALVSDPTVAAIIAALPR